MVSVPPPIIRGEGGGVIWYENLPKICGGKILSDICTRKNLELKINGRVIFITTLLYFYYFISLETAKTQKSEPFL